MSKHNWLNKKNKEQCNWALNYLRKKDMLNEAAHKHNLPYEIVIDALNKSSDEQVGKSLSKSMNGAWRKFKSVNKADNNKQRSYSFTRSTISKFNSLHELNKSNKLSINHKAPPKKTTTKTQTMELLIDTGFEYERKAKEIALAEKRKIKEYNDKKCLTKRRARAEVELRKELEDIKTEFDTYKKQTQKTLTNYQNIADSQLKIICEYLVRLDGYGILNEPLDDAQQNEYNEKYMNIKNRIEERNLENHKNNEDIMAFYSSLIAK